MTKRRAPLSFENALTVVAGLLGWPRVAEICGQAERTVRNWSDPDTSAAISLDAALKLDAAFLAAGGDAPPFHLCYAARLDVEAAAACSSSVELVSLAAGAAKEGGEAIAALLRASRPDASAAELEIAARELEESIQTETAALAAVRKTARGRRQGEGKGNDRQD